MPVQDHQPLPLWPRPMRKSPASPTPTGRLAAGGTALPRKTGTAPNANSSAADPAPHRRTCCGPIRGSSASRGAPAGGTRRTGFGAAGGMAVAALRGRGRSIAHRAGPHAALLSRISHPPPAHVAQALLPAVSTPVRGRGTVSRASVGMSADAAGKSACATSRHPNTREECPLSRAEGPPPGHRQTRSGRRAPVETPVGGFRHRQVLGAQQLRV